MRLLKLNRKSIIITQIVFLNFTVNKPLVNSLLSLFSGVIFCIYQWPLFGGKRKSILLCTVLMLYETHSIFLNQQIFTKYVHICQVIYYLQTHHLAINFASNKIVMLDSSEVHTECLIAENIEIKLWNIKWQLTILECLRLLLYPC